MIMISLKVEEAVLTLHMFQYGLEIYEREHTTLWIHEKWDQHSTGALNEM